MDFQTIYKRYYPSILHYCSNILSSNYLVDAYELAQDCTQECFIEAHKKWGTFKDEQNIKNFLYLVGRNKAFNKLDGIKHRNKYHKEIAYLTSEAELPDYLAMNADIIGFILEQIETLPTQCAVIVKLYFKGLTSHEIAAKLHISNKTALNQRRKSFGLLRQKIFLKFG